MSFISLTFMLFMIMDPIGSISSFLNMVKELPPERKQWVVVREMLIALLTMILFAFLGEYILFILGIDDLTVRLSSGVILFLAALKIFVLLCQTIRGRIFLKGNPLSLHWLFL